jgi:4-aminobutyrate aminotransferase
VQRKGFGSLLGGVFHMPYPNPYRGAFGIRPESCAKDCIAYLEDGLFKRIVDPSDVAAIFVEPIQGEGGYVPAPPEFLKELERICRKHGILLVMDEVQSGMGRTGKWWACDHAGVEPDILCVAKGIASGMPLSAIVARADLMDWTPGAHASTFGGNPVCVAASLATMDLLERTYMENARHMGEFILHRLSDWPEKHKIVGDVRGRGLMIGVEIVRDRRTKERAHDLRERIVGLAFEKGLLLLGAGENTVRLAPPLIIDEEQADFAVRTLEACIAELERSL